MSATNRGLDRLKNDCYVTEPELCDAIVARLIQEGIVHQNTALEVCEPSAGVGTFVRAIKKQLKCKLTAVDINPSFKARLKKAGADKVVIGDWLEHEGKYDFILGNPPFIEAEDHVRHAVRNLKPSVGAVAYLLRLNFFGSTARKDFWHRYPATWVFPITPRPSYLTEDMTPVLNKNGKKGSDATEYAVFVWTRPMLATYERKHVVSQIGAHIIWERKKCPKVPKPTKKKPLSNSDASPRRSKKKLSKRSVSRTTKKRKC